jgi:hypothetical protein
MAADYRTIISKGWHSLTIVRLYEETIGHIAEEHAEFRLQLPSQLEGLMNAIAAPMAVHVSTTDPVRSVVLVSECLTYSSDHVHVPVRIVSGTSGRVLTAYFSSGMYGGRLLWSARDE